MLRYIQEFFLFLFIFTVIGCWTKPSIKVLDVRLFSTIVECSFCFVYCLDEPYGEFTPTYHGELNSGLTCSHVTNGLLLNAEYSVLVCVRMLVQWPHTEWPHTVLINKWSASLSIVLAKCVSHYHKQVDGACRTFGLVTRFKYDMRHLLDLMVCLDSSWKKVSPGFRGSQLCFQ